MRRMVVAGLAAIVLSRLTAQPVEDVIVEIFHQEPATEAGKVPLTTYRVFVDLAEGYTLQMVYGDKRHQLFLYTTTEFFNEPEHGVMYADKIDPAWLDDRAMALDSWLTIGAASSGHMGIMRNLDPDGSIHACPEREGTASAADPLCPEDGLVAVPKVKEVVSFQFYASYLGQIKGQLIETTDAAWAVLGGTKGPTPDNIVLIAQITTDGEFGIKLNLQLGAPDGTAIKVVAANPQEGEFLFEGLSYGRDYHTGH